MLLETLITDKEFDENSFIAEIHEYTDPLILYGAGDRAYAVYRFLQKKHKKISHVVLSRKYYRDGLHLVNTDICVECMEEVLEKYKSVDMILGLPKYFLQEDFHSFQQIIHLIDINIGVVPGYNFGYAYFYDNITKWQWLFDHLSDDHSRNLLVTHLNSRISGKSMPFESSGWVDPEYFLDDIIQWKQREVIIDCGAYIGDTVEEFLQKKPDWLQEYRYYAVEPMKEFYDILKASYDENPNILPILGAVWDTNGALSFSEDGELSHVDAAGTSKNINALTIPTIIEKESMPITLIKMDIEGSEFPALRGAREIIQKDKPRLAICCYHRKEDLITIPEYIWNLCQDYRFYLCPHSAMPTELVLYCI